MDIKQFYVMESILDDSISTKFYENLFSAKWLVSSLHKLEKTAFLRHQLYLRSLLT